MKFKLPTNFKLPSNFSNNNVVKNVLYLVSFALIVSYIINKQSWAVISFIVITIIVYVMNKNIVSALFISISITNILLAMNYLKESNVIEGIMPIIEGNVGQMLPPSTVSAPKSPNITPERSRTLQTRDTA